MLSIESICAGYGGAVVLHDFDLQVGDGEIAAVIGPNGCGKSTLLRCVAGLLRPTSGRVCLDGEEVTGWQPRERARRIALLPQAFAAPSDITVQEMVALGRTPHLGPYGVPGEADLAVVENCLEMTSTGALRDRRLNQLSGGERQRVVLARALAQEPQVLLLDEPTSNLDLRYQYELLDLVSRLARARRLTVVLVLHQINLAAAVADRVALLDGDGRMRASGSPAEVMTEANLQAVYGLPLRVVPHPVSGRPQAQAVWSFGADGGSNASLTGWTG